MVIRKNVENRHSKEIFLNVKRLCRFRRRIWTFRGDTIVGIHHKSAVITLVERLSKAIIALKPEGRKAVDIENSINEWLQSVPKIFSNQLPLIVEKNSLVEKY